MKPNYYSIHKNKSPKHLFRKSKKKPNPHIVVAVLIGAIGAAQMTIIQSKAIAEYKKGGINFNENKQQESPYKRKEQHFQETLIHTAKSVAKELNKAARFEFLQRGHYIRNKKQKQ